MKVPVFRRVVPPMALMQMAALMKDNGSKVWHVEVMIDDSKNKYKRTLQSSWLVMWQHLQK